MDARASLSLFADLQGYSEEGMSIPSSACLAIDFFQINYTWDGWKVAMAGRRVLATAKGRGSSIIPPTAPKKTQRPMSWVRTRLHALVATEVFSS